MMCHWLILAGHSLKDEKIAKKEKTESSKLSSLSNIAVIHSVIDELVMNGPLKGHPRKLVESFCC